MKQICYYELLGIAQAATVEEIRKAYKTRALQLHPDKNHHRLEEATKEFTVLQQAYTVLIDPHERRWYDNHRDAILKGSSGATGVDEDSLFDLMPFFNASAYKGFHDGPKGFFTVYRKVFEDIEAEEHRIYEALQRNNPSERNTLPSSAASFTSFGTANTSFLPSLKDFYAKWTHFSSLRSFSCMDKYHPGDAENRPHRRYLEKENKKLRDAQRKEYNDTVRSLALFVKKRDPRAQLYQTQAKQAITLKNIKEKEARKSQKVERDEAFEEQSWTKVDDNEYLKYFKIHNDTTMTDTEPAEPCDTTATAMGSDQDAPTRSPLHADQDEAYYCPACNKTFKSEQQWTNHEQSKKHLKQVHEIKKLLRKEERMMNKKAAPHAQPSPPPPASQDNESGSDSEAASFKSIQSHRESEMDDQGPEQDLDALDDNVDLETMESHFEDLTLSQDSENESQGPLLKSATNKTKKKRRRANKSDQAVAVDASLKCITCAHVFDSRNALFKHLKSSKHGVPLKSSQAS